MKIIKQHYKGKLDQAVQAMPQAKELAEASTLPYNRLMSETQNQTRPDGAPVAPVVPDVPVGKLILFHGLTPPEAQAAMRAVKAALSTPADLAFAMTTPTNLGWPVAELVTHVMEEHRQLGVCRALEREK